MIHVIGNAVNVTITNTSIINVTGEYYGYGGSLHVYGRSNVIV